MTKTIFEEMGGTYTQVGDYFLPDLRLHENKTQPIGIWGRRHLRYLKGNKRVTYTILLTSGKLNSYLADINVQAEKLFFRLVKQLVKKRRHYRTVKSRESD